MDNISHAIFLAFTMFAMVIGLSYSIYLINNMNSVSSALIQYTDSTRDYKKVGYDSSQISTKGIGSGTTKRIVGIDTVISTLYGYNQESYTIKILDEHGNINQVFDIDIEDNLRNPNVDVELSNSYKNLYGDMFGAPWLVNTESLKQRIDMYVSGQKGYINGKLVDYSNSSSNPGKYFSNWVEQSALFEEQFIQYTYSGETFSDSSNDDIETITGSRKAQNRILIIYKKI